jgi:hypothetical protein
MRIDQQLYDVLRSQARSYLNRHLKGLGQQHTLILDGHLSDVGVGFRVQGVSFEISAKKA